MPGKHASYPIVLNPTGLLFVFQDSKLHLKGLEAYDAAVFCAGLTAAQRHQEGGSSGGGQDTSQEAEASSEPVGQHQMTASADGGSHSRVPLAPAGDDRSPPLDASGSSARSPETAAVHDAVRSVPAGSLTRATHELMWDSSDLIPPRDSNSRPFSPQGSSRVRRTPLSTPPAEAPGSDAVRPHRWQQGRASAVAGPVASAAAAAPLGPPSSTGSNSRTRCGSGSVGGPMSTRAVASSTPSAIIPQQMGLQRCPEGIIIGEGGSRRLRRTRMASDPPRGSESRSAARTATQSSLLNPLLSGPDFIAPPVSAASTHSILISDPPEAAATFMASPFSDETAAPHNTSPLDPPPSQTSMLPTAVAMMARALPDGPAISRTSVHTLLSAGALDQQQRSPAAAADSGTTRLRPVRGDHSSDNRYDAPTRHAAPLVDPRLTSAPHQSPGGPSLAERLEARLGAVERLILYLASRQLSNDPPSTTRGPPYESQLIPNTQSRLGSRRVTQGSFSPQHPQPASISLDADSPDQQYHHQQQGRLRHDSDVRPRATLRERIKRILAGRAASGTAAGSTSNERA